MSRRSGALALGFGGRNVCGVAMTIDGDRKAARGAIRGLVRMSSTGTKTLDVVSINGAVRSTDNSLPPRSPRGLVSKMRMPNDAESG